MVQTKGQTFNDGVVGIYELTDIADPGDSPKDGLKGKEWLRFHRRTVGVTRFYTAKQANAQIEMVIRCQLREGVSTQDVAVMGEKQFRIEQVQYPEEIVPKVMDLSLVRLEQVYAFATS